MKKKLSRGPFAPLAACLLLLSGCAPPDDEAPEAGRVSTAEEPVRTAPETADEVVSRARAAMRDGVRSFRLVERRGGERGRRGTVTLDVAGSRPILDLTWRSGPDETRVTSDGETVFVARPDGGVRYSPWNEAGSVLYARAAGKLLSAAVDPSSFTAYGGSLAEPRESGAVRVEVSLPNGGGWGLAVSAGSWLPVAIEFRGGAEAVVERLELEPVAGGAMPAAADLRLEPPPGEQAERFYAGPAPGDPAPDVTFQLVDGGTVSVAERRGSVVVLDFWATWCVPCRPAMQKLQELHEEHADDGLEVYGLRLFDSGDATGWLADLGVTYPTGDGVPFVEPYAVGEYGLPTLYVIDRAGTVEALVVGFSAGSDAAVEAAVERGLAG